jgi:hypothetical protein
MGYYEGEKSVGLGPIVIAISLVAMLGFASLYFMFGRNIQATNASEEITSPQQKQGQSNASEKTTPQAGQHNRV